MCAEVQTQGFEGGSVEPRTRRFRRFRSQSRHAMMMPRHSYAQPLGGGARSHGALKLHSGATCACFPDYCTSMMAARHQLTGRVWREGDSFKAQTLAITTLPGCRVQATRYNEWAAPQGACRACYHIQTQLLAECMHRRVQRCRGLGPGPLGGRRPSGASGHARKACGGWGWVRQGAA